MFDILQVSGMNSHVKPFLFIILSVDDPSSVDQLSSELRAAEGILEYHANFIVTAILSYGQKGVPKRIALVIRVERLALNQGSHQMKMSLANCEMDRWRVVVLACTQLGAAGN